MPLTTSGEKKLKEMYTLAFFHRGISYQRVEIRGKRYKITSLVPQTPQPCTASILYCL